MTRCGTICTCLIIVLSLISMVVCAVKQGRGTRSVPPGERKSADLPRITGEPMKFRTAEYRFVTCKASIAWREETLLIRGFGLSTQEKQQARRYLKKELAYILADQLIAEGGIDFREEGGELRAQLRAVLPEGGGHCD